MRILLTDRNLSLVQEWDKAFVGLREGRAWLSDERPTHRVELYHRDIFAEPVDALVSPANSFGFMDGGIDQVYTDRFGSYLQEWLQADIGFSANGELLIGQALVISINNKDFPWLISAPTMRVPGVIRDPIAVYLSTRAAVVTAIRSGFDTIAMPGMGTLTGKVPLDQAARLMYHGIMDALKSPPFPSSWRAAADMEAKIRS